MLGAGLRGLQASYPTLQAGLSVSDVETRDQIGGRARRIPLASGHDCVDLGANRTDEQSDPRVMGYIHRLELTIINQHVNKAANNSVHLHVEDETLI